MSLHDYGDLEGALYDWVFISMLTDVLQVACMVCCYYRHIALATDDSISACDATRVSWWRTMCAEAERIVLLHA
jgi:hypothetical protein